MKNKILNTIGLLILVSFFALSTSAQEFNAKVIVNAQSVSSNIDKKIFVTLQNQLTNFITGRKWTNDKFNANERIQCNFVINIESSSDGNVFKGKMMVQSARPVYGSSYTAAMFNYQDQDIAFRYIEYQPIEFNENRVQGSDALTANLPALFAYYINMILGMDYDSFAPKAGESYFQKALNIVNNAPDGQDIKGWKAFDGLGNRYWLNENLTNTKYNIIHDAIYGYYRGCLDKMSEKEKEARVAMTKSITQLFNIYKENSNVMFLQFFIQGKSKELVGIFQNGTPDEKSKAAEMLSALDVSKADFYKQQLQ